MPTSIHKAFARTLVPTSCFNHGSGSVADLEIPGQELAVNIRHLAIPLVNASHNTNSNPGVVFGLPMTRIVSDISLLLKTLIKLEILEIIAPKLRHNELVDCKIWEKWLSKLAIGFMPSTFARLTSISLSLRSTRDFSVLLGPLPDEVFLQLRHLCFQLTDESGPDGTYQMDADAIDDPVGGPYSFTQSKYQELYPDPDYAEDMFAIVNRCLNLENLSIRCTHWVNGDTLNLNTTNLTALDLGRIRISTSNLLKLLSPHADADLACTKLKKVTLSSVELTSGKWSKIFKHLARLSRLDYLSSCLLGYSAGGDSADFALDYLECDDEWSLWSDRRKDWLNLERLVVQLILNAGGKDKYPSDNFEQYVIEGGYSRDWRDWANGA